MNTDIDQLKVLELNRRFHDEVEASSYDERMGVDHSPENVTRTISELEHVFGKPLPTVEQVVDVGSGTGNIAIKLAIDSRFQQVTAVDISKVSLNVLKQHALKHDVCVNTLVSDMRELPFDDKSVDLLVGCAFLHHLPDPDGFMVEVERVLKPGAAFIIIGEPTSFGAILVELVKSPLVMANRLRGLASKQPIFRWEHDHIDVHTFTDKDVNSLFSERFKDVRICNEGFLEPILDQSLLVPLKAVLPQSRLRDATFKVFIRAGRLLDCWVFNKILPAKCLVTLKVSGVRK